MYTVSNRSIAVRRQKVLYSLPAAATAGEGAHRAHCANNTTANVVQERTHDAMTRCGPQADLLISIRIFKRVNAPMQTSILERTANAQKRCPCKEGALNRLRRADLSVTIAAPVRTAIARADKERGRTHAAHPYGAPRAGLMRPQPSTRTICCTLRRQGVCDRREDEALQKIVLANHFVTRHGSSLGNVQ